MTVRNQWMAVGAIVVISAIAIVVMTLRTTDALYSVAPGTRAPHMEGRTLDSLPVRRTLEDYAGDVVLLNIWATFCPPCKEEMPSLDTLYRAFRDQGLKVVAVSVDEPGAEDLIKAFAKDYDLSFDILYDPERITFASYHGTGYPESFVIGRDGVIRRVQYSATNWASPANRALFAQLLAEGAGAEGSTTTSIPRVGAP